ncbi:MAG: hypothetical protein KatS3mg059_0040 [Thermomicrobiales bacterium]|nr:MAG: hypothetical protein KatS3mg059_0040 [Thermomicrobiales bacterium]
MGKARRIDVWPGEQPSPASQAADRPVEFIFAGHRYTGYDGEPVVVALLAAGIRAFPRTANPGDLRGSYCLTGRCADCLVVVDGLPDQRACQVPLRHGMRIEPQVGPGRWHTAGATKEQA